MSILDRKTKEKEELTHRIIKAAEEIFLEEGYDQISIRKIAKKIDYSPGLIYLYFKNKDDLFYDLHKLGYKKFTDMYKKIKASDCMDKLYKYGETYLKFAFKYPKYYELMFIRTPPEKLSFKENIWEHGNEVHEMMIDAVKDCIKDGKIKDIDPKIICFMLWSNVHGIASLCLSKRLHDKDCKFDYEFAHKIFDECSISLNNS